LRLSENLVGDNTGPLTEFWIKDDRRLETEHAGYWSDSGFAIGKSSTGHFAGGVTANRRACP